ncbi:MAG TPA: DUF6519 domain-containing protein, partial [Myxococcaceae bacterium]
MKGDFTRNTFQALRHYSGVRMQQGRVQLDADWNEQLDIQEHADRTERRDLIGPCGAPLELDREVASTGFAVMLGADGGLSVRQGRYYLDGLLCQNERDCPLSAQPDLPGYGVPAEPGRYLAYLDAWPLLVTSVEEPDIREVALNGPDTSVRVRTVWQVKLVPLAEDRQDAEMFGRTWLPEELTSTGTVAARAVPPSPVGDACMVPAGAGYRRLENQLYRVEIHDDSTTRGGPTFKWSRDNGTLYTRVRQIIDDILIVDQAGRDPLRRFRPNQWVELSDERKVLHGLPGLLVQLADVQDDRLRVIWPETYRLPEGEVITVRAWDGASGAEPCGTDGYLDLEDGVQVSFSRGQYRTGDYWLLPARTATGGVLWPQEGFPPAPVQQGRHGTEHRFGALAIVRQDDRGQWSIERDCRQYFAPLSQQHLLLYAGGDGQESLPGQALGSPLAASVVIGQTPLPGARVKFEITVGDPAVATLTGLDAEGRSGPAVVVRTDRLGVAR